jgi:hypothetical protein
MIEPTELKKNKEDEILDLESSSITTSSSINFKSEFDNETKPFSRKPFLNQKNHDEKEEKNDDFVKIDLNENKNLNEANESNESKNDEEFSTTKNTKKINEMRLRIRKQFGLN